MNAKPGVQSRLTARVGKPIMAVMGSRRSYRVKESANGKRIRTGRRWQCVRARASLPHSSGANPIASIPRSFGRSTDKSNQARSPCLEWRFDVCIFFFFFQRKRNSKSLILKLRCARKIVIERKRKSIRHWICLERGGGHNSTEKNHDKPFPSKIELFNY